jgi:DNA-binding NarL/FixJ family response regulator
MRVLIADDNERVRRGVRDFLLTQVNWEVCGEAQDGAEAIEKARELSPDLILLDISMPGLSGFEAASVLRREVPGVKILIMSQNDPVQLLPAAREAGADACVDKSRIYSDLLPAMINTVESTDNPRNERADAV